MKWILYSIALSLLSSGAFVASSIAGVELPPPQQTKPEPEPEPAPEDEDFIPSEKVPADSAISFPVDI